MINKDDIEIIEMDLTTLCNARCPLCFRNHKKFPQKYRCNFFRNFNEIVNQIDEYNNLNTIYLIGQMSEPTTHPDFLKIVKYIKTKNIKIKICTNGDLHNDEFWNILGMILTDNDEVWFTICGSTQIIHEHYRVNTKLDNILHHAQIIRNHKKIDCVKCVKFQYNQKDLESDEFKTIIKQFSQVEFLDTSFPEDRTIYENDFKYDDFLPIQKTLLEYKKINNMSDLYFKLNNKNINCQSIFDKQLQIDPYGNVFPCYKFVENNSNIINWNYKDIKTGKFNCCKFCNQKIVQYCQKNRKNFII